MSKHESRSTHKKVVEGKTDQAKEHEREMRATASDADQIAATFAGMFSAPTQEEARAIAAQVERVKGAVHERMEGESDRADEQESELQGEANDSSQNADELAANRSRVNELYGLNKQYDTGAIDNMVNDINAGEHHQQAMMEKAIDAKQKLQATHQSTMAAIKGALSRM